jgi:hypothetical protein
MQSALQARGVDRGHTGSQLHLHRTWLHAAQAVNLPVASIPLERSIIRLHKYSDGLVFLIC